MVKDMVLVCFLYQFIIMDFNTQDKQILPTTSNNDVA